MDIVDGDLLIVDDSALTRRKIRHTLEHEGYHRIVECGSSEEALELLRERDFDLFLLDILMAGMDGLELCRRIKADPRFADTPVLFVTGSMELQNRWQCFEAGGVDYIPKPFHPHELVNRVKVHLDLLHRNRENQRFADEMESLAEQRAQQLVHAERIGTLGVLTAGIIHEIRNGVGMISHSAQLMQMTWPQLLAMAKYALEHGYEKTPTTDIVLSSFQEGLRDVLDGISRVSGLARDVLRFARKSEETTLIPTDLRETVQQSLALAHNRLKYHVQVVQEFPPDLPPVMARSGPLSQVLVNLFLNAADATEDRSAARLRIAAERRGDEIHCTVSDDGCGMSAETLAHLWDPFFTTKHHGTGLGLNLSRKIMQDLGGGMEASSRLGEGTCFTLRLKAAATPAA